MPARRHGTSQDFCASAALVGVALLLGMACAQRVTAQRVQIPNTPPPTYAPAAPAFDPYGSGGALGVPVAPPAFGPPTTIYGAAPQVAAPQAYGAAPAAPAFGAPPLGASPYDAPFSGYAPTAPAYDPAAPPSGPGIGPEYGAIGWQPGTYGFENSDGTVTRIRQFLARLRGEHTFLLSGGSSDDFDVNRTEIAATFAVPFSRDIDTPVLITPGFAFNWFEGPVGDPTAMPRGPDLPPRVYDAYLDLAMYPKFSPALGAELGFRTGVWTDFEEFNEDTMRYLGRGLGVVSLSPRFDLLLGVVYLDRLEVKLLPAGGVRWRPTPQWDLYLVFPNPKVRRTLHSLGGVTWWWFASGEYGGGSWTIERPDLDDRIDYNDVRITTGLEWETPGQARGHLEIGYVFEREVVYQSGMPVEFEPDDAILFRAGIGY